MNTLLIVYFVLGLILIYVCLFTELILPDKLSILMKDVLLVVLLCVLAFGMLFIPTQLQKNDIIGDATLVQRYQDADLYYDTETDIYFAVESNIWNPFEMYRRVELPRALVENKIEK